MKFLTAIFGTGIYFYAATILFQHGFNTYFGIPANFIEVSLRDNVIFLFGLTQLAGSVLSSMSFLVWIVLIILTLVIWFCVAFQIVRGFPLVLGLVLITGFSLFGFHNFGNKVASITTEFHVVPDGCLAIQENTTYIIPAFYGSTALIVPVETVTRKLKGGFIAKETSDLNCEIKKSNIGLVSR